MRVLITGGAGYIGSHTCLELLRAEHEVHVVDSLYKGHAEALECLADRVCDIADLMGGVRG